MASKRRFTSQSPSRIPRRIITPSPEPLDLQRPKPKRTTRNSKNINASDVNNIEVTSGVTTRSRVCTRSSSKGLLTKAETPPLPVGKGTKRGLRSAAPVETVPSTVQLLHSPLEKLADSKAFASSPDVRCEKLKSKDDKIVPVPITATSKYFTSTPDVTTPGRSESKNGPLKVSETPKLPFAKFCASEMKISGFKRLQALAKADSKIDVVDLEPSAQKEVNVKDLISWNDRHFPSSVMDHFVHKKKIEEFTEWLQSCAESNSKKSNMCLLSGPSGSGKTATVFLVAKELNYAVKEFINPVDLIDSFKGKSDGLHKDDDEVRGKSQIDNFTEFLFRSSQYKSLPIKGRKSSEKHLIVVEDFPNAVYRDSLQFHDILRNCSKLKTTPIVFIVSDSASSDTNVNKLFPKSILTELGIYTLSLNPVAHSFMVKFLSSVCDAESINVDFTLLDSIAATSNGDVRSAVNLLQYKLGYSDSIGAKGAAGFKKPPTKRPRNAKANAVDKEQTFLKDDSLFLFHALGKVLNAKRHICKPHAVIEDELNAKLEPQKRPNPLQENPENIVSKIEVHPESFLSFLQQNYSSFFSSLQDMSDAASFLGDAEYMLSHWAFLADSGASSSMKIKEVKTEVSLSVAIRGVMHANNNPATLSWRPLKKPICGDIHIRCNNMTSQVQRAFNSNNGSVLQDVFLDKLPFCEKMAAFTPHVFSTDQKHVAREYVRLPTYINRNQTLLTENEAEEPSQDSPQDVNSQTYIIKPPLPDKDEEVIIEEFED